MMDPSTTGAILAELEAYDPESDASEPLTFAAVSREFPFYGGETGGFNAIRVADFASMAYCPYQSWNRTRGIPVIRPARVAKAALKGTQLHFNREAHLLEEVAKAKPATKKQLRDSTVDLVELPEVPGRFQRAPWVYVAKLDGLSRTGGDLVVHELKTGRYPRKPDHLLQVWAYCLASPGAMVRATNGDLRARGLEWVLEYSSVGDVWGPHVFRQRQANLLKRAMEVYEATCSRALRSEAVDLGWSPIPARCAPCGFAHACSWKAEP
jgi:CRISPR/Cas system-associated exonuclease Cas4 (RecB family)